MQESNLKVTKEQLNEWIEHPATLALKGRCEIELEKIVYGLHPSGYLHRGNPGLTQEELVENATKELEWETFIDLLEGVWTAVELDDEYSEENDVE